MTHRQKSALASTTFTFFTIIGSTIALPLDASADEPSYLVSESDNATVIPEAPDRKAVESIIEYEAKKAGTATINYGRKQWDEEVAYDNSSDGKEANQATAEEAG